MEIQTAITKQQCNLYDVTGYVCPPRLQENVFTLAANDNLDHNPTSSTAKNYFHGTGISIFQYPRDGSQPVQIPSLESCHDTEIHLPGYNTTVQPTKLDPVSPPLPTANPCHIKRIECFEESKDWLQICVHTFKMVT